MFYLVIILFSVGWILLSIIRNYVSSKSPLWLWSGESLLWVKLSNYGKPLKLLIPNYIRKNMNGPINHWCKVISYEMIEKEMGNHVSKLVTFLSKSIAAQEQRVNGSWCGTYTPHLRYTLAGFERNYQVNIPSNQKKYT